MKIIKSKAIVTICLFLLFGTILFGNQVTQSAYDGIVLCLQVVVPSLFPLFVLCTYLNSYLFLPGRLVPRLICKFCKIPKESVSILLIGLLGGYPIGAQCVTQNYNNTSISKDAAERMLGFCNNAGPAFIFGMLSSCFPGRLTLCLLWIVQIISSLLTAHFLPGNHYTSTGSDIKRTSHSLPKAMNIAIRGIVSVCGWVILFKVLVSVVSAMLKGTPVWLSILICGCMELVNGCSQLIFVKNLGLRFILASVFLNFGGLCVHLQTSSVTGTLRKKYYIPGKLLQTTIAAAISFLLQLVIYTGNNRYIIHL